MKEPILFWSVFIFATVIICVFLFNIDVIASQKNQTLIDLGIQDFQSAQVILSSKGSVLPQP